MAEDLKDYRERKEGKVTPKSLTEGLVEWVNTGEVETLIYVVKTKDGEVITGYSTDMNTTHIGMLEFAKLRTIEETF